MTPREIVLVTGATGFVGRALVQRLIDDAARDASAPAVRAAVRTSLEKKTPWSGAAEVVVTGEMDGGTDWSSAVRGVACIIHSAGLAHLPAAESAGADARFTAVNVDATLALAQAAVQAGVRRFVFVSTIKVNGEETLPGHPFTAHDPPVPDDSTDAYGRSKVAAEAGLRRVAAGSTMELVIVRPPLVYGPGARANFGALLDAVARGIPLPLGGVHNRRSLVALDNLVDFLVTASRHPAAAGQVLLVSDGDDLSTGALVRRIGVAMGRTARVMNVPVSLLQLAGALTGRGAAVRRLRGSLQVDSAPSHARLGWHPPLSVHEGLRRAVAPLVKARGGAASADVVTSS